MRAVSGVVSGLTAIIVMTTATLAPLPSAAAQPPRVPALNCGALAAQSGKVWQTTFWGWRVDDFGFRQEFMASPCFTTEANCKAWLYWARSDFDPNYVPPKLCHRVR